MLKDMLKDMTEMTENISKMTEETTENISEMTEETTEEMEEAEKAHENKENNEKAHENNEKVGKTVNKTITKKDILLKSLYEYYTNCINMEYLVEILKDKSCVSLRLIDWFVTKYSKYNNTEYIWNNKNFNVFNSYKSQLKAYSKKQMDPFCRRQRVSLSSNDMSIITTCGQMNFFKWAIENGILKYVVENYTKIDLSMKTENKYNSKKKIQNVGEKGEKGEKRKITKKVITNTKVPVTVFFD